MGNARATTATQRPNLDEVRERARALAGEGKVEDALELVLGLLSQALNHATLLELEKLRLLRKHMGRTSERVSDAQLSLLHALLGTPAPMPEPDAPLDAPDVALPARRAKPRRKGHGRSALPSHLPRQEIVHAVPEAERRCPTCGVDRVCIGHETSEVLEFVPASFRVEVHKREKLACSTCEKGVAIAAVPDKVIEKGRPGAGLLAQVMIAKYADHIPLTRQRTMYRREGVDLPVSTMVDWVAAVSASLTPLVARLEELVLGAHVLQVDDTGIKVLDRDEPGGTKKGHLWCYVGDATWTVFRYTPDWRKEGPQSFLEPRRGWIVADAYKGYDGLFAKPGATAIEVGCWAHARRPFAELALEGDPRAAPVIDAVRALYKIEEQATVERADADTRLRRRQTESASLVETIVKLCTDIRGRAPPSDPLAKGAGYILNQERALRRFLEDGHLPIDNTLVERRLRPIATGRRNYLFCGSDAGAERAAVVYTLFGNCALVGVDPRAYMTWVLTELETGHVPASRIDELLPAHWATICPPTARTPTSR